jgi:hypothetical protein
MKLPQLRELFWLFLLAVFIVAWYVAMREAAHLRRYADGLRTALESDGYGVRYEYGEVILSRDGKAP